MRVLVATPRVEVNRVPSKSKNTAFISISQIFSSSDTAFIYYLNYTVILNLFHLLVIFFWSKF